MTSLYVKRVGQGHPLILIHGWGWHSGIWEPLIPYLEKEFELILVDLPGFGKSPLFIKNYTFQAIAKELCLVAPKKAVWIGWSLGGMLAWWMAIYQPQRVSHLITIASSPKFVSDTDWPGVPFPTLEKFSQALFTNYEKTLEDFLKLQLRGSPHPEILFLKLQQQILNTPKAALPALLGSLKLLEKTDLRTQLPNVTCPSLHLFGQLDTLVPVRVVPLIQKQLPLAQCEIIQHSGHIPFLTHTHEVIQFIKNILRYPAQ